MFPEETLHCTTVHARDDETCAIRRYEEKEDEQQPPVLLPERGGKWQRYL